MIKLKPCTPDYFGDLWRFTSYALSLSEQRDETVGLALGDASWALVKEIANELDHDGTLAQVDSGDPLRIADTRTLAAKKTKTRWLGDGLFIAYRFDTHYDPTRKSAPANDHVMFVKRFPASVYLSRSPAKLPELIDIAAAASMAVCVETGINQLLYAVGCPTYVLKYGASQHHIDEWNAQAGGVYKDIPAFLEGFAHDNGLRRVGA